MADHPRFVAFRRAGATHYGLVVHDRVIDMSVRAADRWPTLRALIEANALRQAADLYAEVEPDYALSDLELEAPVPAGGKILCVGVNFPDRAAEYGGAISAPEHPSLFVRFAGSLVGHGQSLLRPPESEQFDYEGEIVLVLGKGGRRIAETEALGHVAALSLCNEGSVRDWMRHGKFNVTQGKNFDASGALGPWLVAFEDEAQISDIRLTTRVNGEIRQDDRTSRMLFGMARLISYISTFATLEAGDVIVTGTPSGAGARHDPPIWLQPGDAVEVSADGIGTLSNVVADEPRSA